MFVNLTNDLQELQESIYTQYQEVVTNIPGQKSDFVENSLKLKTIVDKNGEEQHKEIDNLIKKIKFDIDEMNSKHTAVLNKQESEIQHRI